MRSVALVAATAICILLSYWTGTTTAERRDNLRQNLCLTNKALAKILSDSLSGANREQIERVGVEKFREIRLNYIGYIHDFEENSPCEFRVRIPPDPTLSGNRES